MRSGKDTCRDFLENPSVNPFTDKKIKVGSESFNFLVDFCEDYGIRLSATNMKKLLYSDEEYGKLICTTFLKNEDINPIDGAKLIKGKGPYNEFVSLCKHYGYIPSEPVRSSDISLKSKSKRTILPQSPKTLRIPTRTTNVLNIGLERLAAMIVTDPKIKEQVSNMLDRILEKHAYVDEIEQVYKFIGEKGKYNVVDFTIDLLQNNEMDLVYKIIDFYIIDYSDLGYEIFGNEKYAFDQQLVEIYFINAPIVIDWSFLDNALDEPYGNWSLEEKMRLMDTLLRAAISVENRDIISEIGSVWLKWRDPIQEEIEELDDEDSSKEQLYGQFDEVDTLIAEASTI